MHNKPVTILVAVKNLERTVGKCVKSLLETDWPQKNVIIIDNMSTDGSFEVLKTFGDQITVYQIEGGLSQIFNQGIRKVQTEYVAFTDADCVVEKNWLKELMKPFDEESDLVATAGFCGTPSDASLLQKLIGLELESRFKRFPKYIKRAPTMNLCVKTEIAKKIKFDEQFSYQAFETDFGYRLTKLGKMAYTPDAKVIHYHRASIRKFFKQQKNQAKWGIILLLKHGRTALADHITTLSMTMQIPISFLIILFALLSLFDKLFLYPTALFSGILLSLYLKNLSEIKPPIFYSPLLLALLFLRTAAWIIGSSEGFIMGFKKNNRESN